MVVFNNVTKYELEQRLRLALDAARMGTWEWDISTNRNRWSEQLNVLLGIPPGICEGILDDWLAMIHPEDRQAVRDALWRSVEQGGRCVIEYRFPSPDGGFRWFEGNGEVLTDESGKAVRMVGVCADISDRKQAEMRLQQAQKMEVTGRMAGAVAHDFNNLLTVILGCCENLEEDPDLSGDGRDLVREIHQAGSRAAALTRQMLAFSRQQVLQARVLNLNDVVCSTAKMLERLIGEDVALTTTLASKLWPVKVDAGQFEQVLVNLAVNARDAMPHGGRLCIETANIELDESSLRTNPDIQPGPYVKVSVSDTGCGMDEKTKARIFEPFFTTKEVGKGTGLGLATSYGIVKQSHGHITVSSEPGNGTTINIFLPKVDAASTPNLQEESHASRPGGMETVLIVEDEDLVRSFCCRCLRSQGYTVLDARNGNEALLTVEQHTGPIDLILTDVVMPEMNGRQLSEQLRATHPDLKVLFMSGYTDDAVVRHGVLEAETDFIQKPFSQGSLGQKVRELLD